MHARRYIVAAVLAGSVVLPVMIGASCPPPSNPPFISSRTGVSTAEILLPPCDPNYVCITIFNRACIDVEVALYKHDGFDPQRIYPAGEAFACCQAPNPSSPCPCLRPGAEVGELQLTRPELFQVRNLTPILIGGANTEVLPQEGGSITAKIQCEDIKSMGVAVGRVGNMPGSSEARAGAQYRCSLVAVGPGEVNWERFQEDVPCGETIAYIIYDLNECVDPLLTRLAIQNRVTMPCPSITPIGPSQ